jgi:hypothetical protein
MFPGGSPVALARPEEWSLFGFDCPACRAMRCDRCATRTVGMCACGQPLRLSIRPAPQEPGREGATADGPANQPADPGRVRAFADAIAALVGGSVVDYSTVDFGRERKGGALTLLLDRSGQPEGERGIALVQLLRSMGLPVGIQVFANTLRDLGREPEHQDRDQVVFFGAPDVFEAIRVAEVDPANHDLTSEDVVAQLLRWHERHGVEIVAADSETVVLRFLRLPDDLSALTAEIVEFCPDLQEVFELDPQALGKSGWLWLWWD